MTERFSHHERRTEPRYPVTDNREIDAELTWPDELAEDEKATQGASQERGKSSKNSLNVKVLDLSRSGARFSTRNKIDKDRKITLRIRIPRADVDLTVSGTVTWAAPRTNQWDIGCRFDEKLPAETLGNLAEHNFLERRRDMRSSIEGEATLTSAATSESTTVQLRDISMGGFSVYSPQPFDLEEPLLLEIRNREKPIRVVAQAQWQTNSENPNGDNEYILGCCFRNASSAHALQESVKSPRVTNGPTNERPFLGVGGWGMVGLVFAFIYCVVRALR